MNPFLTGPEQLARARAADWARMAEQRRLSHLATRHDASGQQPPASLSALDAGPLSRWVDRLRTLRDSLPSGAIRSAHAPK